MEIINGHEVEIRTMTREDFPGYDQMVINVWMPLTPDVEAESLLDHPEGEFMFSDAYEIYPDGFLCAFVDGKLVGEARNIRVHYDMDNPASDWRDISGWKIGKMFAPHEDDGETIYLIALGVDPSCRGLGIGHKLVKALEERCRELGCKRVALGCRVPGYHEHADVPIEEYITWKREDGQYYDPELRFYSRCGMQFGKPLPEYMTEDQADPESLNYGVQAYWDNPDYKG